MGNTSIDMTHFFVPNSSDIPVTKKINFNSMQGISDGLAFGFSDDDFHLFFLTFRIMGVRQISVFSTGCDQGQFPPLQSVHRLFCQPHPTKYRQNSQDKRPHSITKETYKIPCAQKNMIFIGKRRKSSHSPTESCGQQ